MAIRHLRKGSAPLSQQHERNSDAPSAPQRRYVVVKGYGRLFQILVPQQKNLPLPSPIESFRKSWEEAMTGQVKPIHELWDTLDD